MLKINKHLCIIKDLFKKSKHKNLWTYIILKWFIIITYLRIFIFQLQSG